MKTAQRTVYIARDGRDFASEALCRAHERKTCGTALIGLTEAEIEQARIGADPELAEAIEMFGYELRKARQAKGDLKRRKRPNGPNNPEHNAEPPLPGNRGMGSAGDSRDRTDSERAPKIEASA